MPREYRARVPVVVVLTVVKSQREQRTCRDRPIQMPFVLLREGAAIEVFRKIVQKCIQFLRCHDKTRVGVGLAFGFGEHPVERYDGEMFAAPPRWRREAGEKKKSGCAVAEYGFGAHALENPRVLRNLARSMAAFAAFAEAGLWPLLAGNMSIIETASKVVCL